MQQFHSLTGPTWEHQPVNVDTEESLPPPTKCRSYTRQKKGSFLLVSATSAKVRTLITVPSVLLWSFKRPYPKLPPSDVFKVFYDIREYELTSSQKDTQGGKFVCGHNSRTKPVQRVRSTAARNIIGSRDRFDPHVVLFRHSIEILAAVRDLSITPEIADTSVLIAV